MNTRINALVALFLVLCLHAFFASFAMATHEVWHRFKVYGYVKDGDGNARGYTKVSAVDLVTDEKQSNYTDGNGYYEIVLHLHDENLGDVIMVNTESASQGLTTSFDPSDHETERKARVDLIEVTPAPDSSASSPIDSRTASIILISFTAMVIFGYLGYSKWKKVRRRSRLQRKKRRSRGH